MRAIAALALSATLFGCSGSDLVIPEEQGTADASSDGASDGVTLDTTSNDAPGTDATPDGSADSGDDASIDGEADTGAEDGGADGLLPDVLESDTAPPTDAADGSTPKTCTSTKDCDPGEYCEMPTCGSGTCKTKPSSIGPFAPACGCDGITYYSAAYAATLGVSAKSGSGECVGDGRATCGGVFGKSCPHSTNRCAREVGGSFGCTTASALGTCWQMPKDVSCPDAKGPYNICGGDSCENQCEAVVSGKAFYKSASCK